MTHASKLVIKVTLAEKLQASQPQYVICQTLNSKNWLLQVFASMVLNETEERSKNEGKG